MSFKFRPAERKGVHVILGAFGGTGSGKTWSALEIATGLAGDKEFAFIDTEAGRAEQYADYFKFQHGDLGPPFSPDAYLEAILAAEHAKFPVAVVDSFSHEHAGEGGILDMHDAEHKRLGGRDSTKMLAWVKPKTQHKKMVARLLQLRIHLILCFRAEPKLSMKSGFELTRDGKLVSRPGKTAIVDMGWQPIGAKGLEFEMAASWMLRNENPGYITQAHDELNPSGRTLKMPEPLKEIFSGDYRLNRQHGEKLALWAAGGSSAEGPAERSIGEMVKEEYVAKGMDRETVTGLLVTEGLMIKGEGGKLTFSPDASHAEVRHALDLAKARS